MKFQPLGKRVLVEREEEATTTATGIIIPDNASKEKPMSGKVIAISKEAEGIKEGDKIVFAKYSGSEITIDGKTFLVLNTDDVLGILK
ncbi:10 kD chaperonin (cpn10) [Candidatus Campylobacter infans]|uniref:Co-chaperonin GroES n=1 Tax=Candidatus Campylobacter infans TaxID=2561898 RepID=A0A7H9CID9_9BACT|nr:co-chaperone GroES [Candidatus Campylobacter infans]KAF0591165.1 MAG: 10 kD chaperonin (cpn10) [Candidatus Campylobacter infans]QLI05873.1 10 kD chaperonin (cpn10) [Candidatus Campylobacter infans]